MFQIITRSPLDEEWASRDAEIEIVAGRRSDQSGTNGGSKGYRWHMWQVQEFHEAKLLKELLMRVVGVFASMREK